MKCRLNLPGSACLAIMIALTWFSPVPAEIHFSEMPDRAGATLTIEGTRTLVEEERLLALDEGINEIRFSWQGASILESSVRLRILDDEKITVTAGTNHPSGEKALMWRVHSSKAAVVPARINYVMHQIDGLFPIRLIADESESSCTLEQYVVLRNFSGEDFGAVSVITPGGTVRSPQTRHGETLRIPLSLKDNVGIEKIWRYDSHAAGGINRGIGEGIRIYYRISNSDEAGLGEAPIPGGKVRIFHRDGKGGELFLGEDGMESLPIGGSAELFLGESRDISVRTAVMEQTPVNIRRNVENRIVLYDLDEIVRFRVENFKDTPVTLNLRRHIPGEWDMTASSTPSTRSGAHMVEFNIQLGPESLEELTFQYTRRNLRSPELPVGPPEGFHRLPTVQKENR